MELDNAENTAVANGGIKENKKRERKKHILSALQKQIEFYFGDANLRHDRFLRRAIQNEADGYVDIKVIADFNKMKQITNDEKLVTKAMKNSGLLQMSEDEKRVKRKLPLPEQVNTDAQTVYVERLPPYADQDWLREVFSCCGNIDYISLPRYKNTKDIKGFAFVEYSTPEAAEKACQVLNSVHSRINNTPLKSTVNSEKKQSTCEDKSIKRKRRKSASFSETEFAIEDEHCNSHRRKRRRCISESSNLSSDIDCKSNRTDNTDDCRTDVDSNIITAIDDSSATGGSIEKTVSKHTNLNFEAENDPLTSKNNQDNAISHPSLSDSSKKDCDIDIETTVDSDSKKMQKGKKKRKRNKKAKEEKMLDIPPLSVITKKEWLRLKEMYKMLQRGETKSLKMEIKQDSHLNSEYQKNRCTNEDAASSKSLTIPIVSGTILQVNALDANGMLTKQTVKKELAPLASIAYLDVKEGENQGFIRLSNQQDALSLMKIYSEESHKFPFILKKLSDAEEDSYHKKIKEDRKRKFSSQQSKKERGKDKINKKVNKVMDRSSEVKREHIRFDEN